MAEAALTSRLGRLISACSTAGSCCRDRDRDRDRERDRRDRDRVGRSDRERGDRDRRERDRHQDSSPRQAGHRSSPIMAPIP